MASRIKQERINSGFSQADLASQMGVRPNTIGRWEKNASCVKQAHLIKMSQLFDCSIAWLVGVSDTRGSALRTN